MVGKHKIKGEYAKMITITKTQKHYDPIDDNFYIVRLIGVKLGKKNEEHPDWEPRLVFTFELMEPPFEKRRAWGCAPQLWQEGRKLDRWLKALGVDQADEGCQLDVEQLKGQYARAHIKTDDGSEYPTVIDVQPLRQADVEKLNAVVAGKTAVAPVQAAPVAAPAPIVVKPVAAAPVIVPVTPVVTVPVTPAPSAPKIRAIPF
jgi:hypothetical protein